MQNVGQNQLVVAKRGPAALFRENDRKQIHRMSVVAEYLVSTMRVTVLSQSDEKIGAHRSIFDQSFGYRSAVPGAELLGTYTRSLFGTPLFNLASTRRHYCTPSGRGAASHGSIDVSFIQAGASADLN